MSAVRRVLPLILLATSVAHAEDADSLFAEGKRLVETGAIDSGCAKFQASLDLDPALGTTLHLASCRDKQGRVADAYRLFERAEALAKSRKDKRAAVARRELARLGKQIARLSLTVGNADTPGLTIKVGDLVVTDLTGVHVVDPGQLTIEVSAPGYITWSTVETALRGKSLTVVIPDLVAGANADPALLPDSEVRTESGGKVLPWLIIGTGVAMAGTGIALRLTADPDQDTRSTVGLAVAIAGGVAVVLGVVIYIKTGDDPVILAPTASPTSVGLSLTGFL
jgi:hypothetical protein